MLTYTLSLSQLVAIARGRVLEHLDLWVVLLLFLM